MACETDRQDDGADHATPESVEAQADGGGRASGISLDQFWATLDPLDA